MKGEREKMTKNRIAIFATLILCLIIIGVVAAKVYWQMSITSTFHIYGIDGLLTSPTYDDMTTQTPATDFDEFGRIALTLLVVDDPTTDVWLNITTQANIDNVTVEMTGQYYRAYCVLNGIYTFHFDPVDGAFPIVEGEQLTVDRTLMTWADCNYEGNNAYCLVVTVDIITENVQAQGTFELTTTFQLGYIE